MITGYTLSEQNGVAVIATLNSANAKTGNMVQVWILCSDIRPSDAVKSGADSRICGDCPARGGHCYVKVFQAPTQVYAGYKAGKYPYLPSDRYNEVFSGRAIRLGAYGDPAFIPQTVIESLVSVADRWTGYTHQWRTADWLKPYVMASVDSPLERRMAHADGWRTFRTSVDAVPLRGEILCPASKEAGEKTSCIQCGLCNGATDGDRRKSIMIPVHGSSASKFRIIQ